MLYPKLIKTRTVSVLLLRRLLYGSQDKDALGHVAYNFYMLPLSVSIHRSYRFCINLPPSHLLEESEIRSIFS